MCEVIIKVCPRCKTSKEFNSINFYRSKHNKYTGLSYYCKICDNKKVREYRKSANGKAAVKNKNLKYINSIPGNKVIKKLSYKNLDSLINTILKCRIAKSVGILYKDIEVPDELYEMERARVKLGRLLRNK